jgi:hypothetical protein
VRRDAHVDAGHPRLHHRHAGGDAELGRLVTQLSGGGVRPDGEHGPPVLVHRAVQRQQPVAVQQGSIRRPGGRAAGQAGGASRGTTARPRASSVRSSSVRSSTGGPVSPPVAAHRSRG